MLLKDNIITNRSLFFVKEKLNGEREHEIYLVHQTQLPYVPTPRVKLPTIVSCYQKFLNITTRSWSHQINPLQIVLSTSTDLYNYLLSQIKGWNNFFLKLFKPNRLESYITLFVWRWFLLDRGYSTRVWDYIKQTQKIMILKYSERFGVCLFCEELDW